MPTSANTAANDVSIKRLHLRAQAHWQQRIHPRLEQVQWPTLGPDEYLFIRQLSLTVRDAELESSLSALVAQLAGEATNGQQPNVETASVIRFPSYTRLLAALTEDLHYQRAKSRWFWRDWQHLLKLPTTEAITELWAGEPLHLAELCARLSTNGSLAAIWKPFTPAQFQRIGLALAHSTGVAADVIKNSGSLKPTASKPPLTPPRRLLQRWEKVLTTTDAGNQSAHPATQLAALLTLLEWRPDVLLSEVAGEAVRVVGEQLTRKLAPAFVIPVPASHANTEQPKSPAKKAAIASTKPANNASRRIPVSEPRPDLAVPTDGAVDGGRSLSPPNALPEIPPAEHTNEETSAGAGSLEVDPWARPDGHEFSTQFSTKIGGLFYLLNFLDQQESLALIKRSGGFEVLSGGWGWLYQLGVTVGLEADPPLARFIASQLELESPDALAYLPGLPNEDAFLTLFQQRYQRLQPWASRLLTRPARVTATASHLDLYFHLHSVDLDIRLAGLDINPGWLPWLGRVVHFHFLENPFAGGGNPR